MLKQASPMHDIGKVGIHDSILNKPLRFDDIVLSVKLQVTGYIMITSKPELYGFLTFI
mgnify:CR=1 FL=1